MYTGVVFDFDGVLYDSEKHWDVIENKYLINRIPRWDPADYKNLIGRSLPEAYAYLQERGLPLSEEQYTSDYHEMADLLYREYAKPIQGIDTLLYELSARERRIAIASSSKHSWINAALESNKLSVKIPTIVSAEDKAVSKGKPAPDVYIIAAQLLGESPSKLIAIEDSKNGVLSATAAGLYCIGLRNGFNDSQDLSNADEVINGYSAESIARIMSLLT